MFGLAPFPPARQGKLLAIRQLLLKGLTPPVIIFVQSKTRASEVLIGRRVMFSLSEHNYKQESHE